jgi:hypothetical protein
VTVRLVGALGVLLIVAAVVMAYLPLCGIPVFGGR